MGARRAGCAEHYCPGRSSPVNAMKQQNNLRGRLRVGATDGVDCPTVEMASDELLAVEELPAVALLPVYLEDTVKKRQIRTDNWNGQKPDLGRDWLSQVDWRKEDLDVGGWYKIPKKPKNKYVQFEY